MTDLQKLIALDLLNLINGDIDKIAEKDEGIKVLFGIIINSDIENLKELTIELEIMLYTTPKFITDFYK